LRVLAAGACLAGLGIALGALGAHGLKHLLDAERLGWWQTGVQYETWHGLALVALSAAPLDRLKLPAWLLGAGACVFSFSLYLMALTDWRWLGAVTPFGGLAMSSAGPCSPGGPRGPERNQAASCALAPAGAEREGRVMSKLDQEDRDRLSDSRYAFPKERKAPIEDA
jgi:uncharacterized membrane protein YgdD (TMEM256/DUF423 family)